LAIRSKTAEKTKSNKKVTKKEKKYNIIPKEEIIKKAEEEILAKIKKKDYVKQPKEYQEPKNYFDKSKKPPIMLNPGPGAYDFSNTIEIDKGFSFGSKGIPQEANKIDIPYYSLKSDFENIEEHVSFSRADRFKKEKNPYDMFTFNENQLEKVSKKVKDNLVKLKEERMKKFESDLKTNDEKAIKRMQNAEEFQRERNERLMEKEKKNVKRQAIVLPGPGKYNPKYSFTDDQGPSYTLGAKLEKGGLNSKVYDDPNKNYNLEQSFSLMDKKNKNLYPLPNYNKVKPEIAGCVFGSAERFPPVKNSDIPGPNEYNEIHTVDVNNDRKKVLYFGKDKRFGEFQKTFFEGPELYKIAGFAETLVKKKWKIKST